MKLGLLKFGLLKFGLIWTIAAGVCVAQTQAEKRGKELIDKTVQALGGENFLKMADRVETGRAYSFYREQISGLSIAKIYTRYITLAPIALTAATSAATFVGSGWA